MAGVPSGPGHALGQDDEQGAQGETVLPDKTSRQLPLDRGLLAIELDEHKVLGRPPVTPVPPGRAGVCPRSIRLSEVVRERGSRPRRRDARIRPEGRVPMEAGETPGMECDEGELSGGGVAAGRRSALCIERRRSGARG